MARIKKRKDGLQQACFRVDGKRYVVYGRTAKELAEKKQKKMQEIAAGIEKHYNPTLNQYYQTFTENRKKKVKPATLRTQAKHFNACAVVPVGANGKLFGEVKIRDIKKTDCQTVQHALAETSSSRTVNDRIAHLKHVFKAAVEDETISKNPCASLEPLRRTEPAARETKHRALSKKETADFFEAAAESYYLNAYKLMVQTGMRIGEVGALRMCDIDSKVIHVTRTITRDEMNGYIIGDTPKTDTSNRDIPLNDAIRETIRNQKELNREVFGNVLQIDGLLFRSAEGCIIRECTVNNAVKRICKAADIEFFTCHAFRATFATRFIEQRPQDYKVLSEILGHANTKITLDLYTHVMKDTKKNAMESIEIAI